MQSKMRQPKKKDDNSKVRDEHPIWLYILGGLVCLIIIVVLIDKHCFNHKLRDNLISFWDNSGSITVIEENIDSAHVAQMIKYSTNYDTLLRVDKLYNKPLFVDNRTKVIGDTACANCSKITKIILPPSIKMIKTLAFDLCSSLEEINLPDSLFQIEDKAFRYCFNIHKIRIPKSLTNIGINPFLGIENMLIESDNSRYCVENNYFLVDKKDSKIISYVGNLKKVNNFPNVRSVGQESFYSNKSIEDISFVNSQIKEIHNMAFGFCKNIKSIQFAKNNFYICGVNPFIGVQIKSPNFSICQNLIFTNGLLIDISKHKLISYAGIASNVVLQIKSLPDTSQIRIIGEKSFAYCKNIRTIDITHVHIDSICADAFQGTTINMSNFNKQ